MSKAVRALLVLAAALPPAAAAQADSAARPPLIRPAEAVAAAGLVAGSVLIDGWLRDEAQAQRSTATNDLASFGNHFGDLRWVGPPLVAGWVAGRLTGHPRLAEATAKAFGAAVVAGAATGALKVVIGRVRPRDTTAALAFRPFTKNTSFPSGHTTVAVAIASSLAHSTPDGWSDVLFYGLAGLTGFARINDNKHWLSDVAGGAVVGYLAGRQLTAGPGRAQVIAGPDHLGLAIPLGPLGDHIRNR
ncbi:MAG: phosphatase PAP2 family protein [Gemmatimonadales bacterium]